jgi:hypothetical protein
MLHIKTVEPGTFSLLKKLMGIHSLRPFSLVGGTGIAVRNVQNDSDNSAMIIQALLGRGKKKDFWDLHELLRHYSLQQVIDWHKEKYPSQMLAISIPNAITYFVDAESSETPVSYKGQTWEQVKKEISKAVSEYLK